jgi:hypothetical protein
VIVTAHVEVEPEAPEATSVEETEAS